MSSDYQKQWYQNNRQRLLEYRRAWYQKNKEKRSEYFKNRRLNDPEYKELTRTRSRTFKENEKLALLEILGNKCVRCGFTDKRALQLDHIEGGGCKERKVLFNSPSSMIHFYVKNPEIAKQVLQVLCANCNVIKRIENKEF